MDLIGDFWTRGLSIIPVEPRGKRPAVAWKPYQVAPAPFEQVTAWFGNGHDYNIGIVTGAVSGIVAIDCDSREAIAWADAHLPATPMITRTAKGEHRFFRHPGRPIRNKARLRTGETQIALDVRADGGFVVAPGSVHETGAIYEKAGSWPPVIELPVFDPTWLEPEPTKPAATAPTRATRPSDREHVRDRARKYLAATPPAIEGQGGDEHTFQVCCRLVRGFDLSDADAFDLLFEWNARCVPPWTEGELLAKIEGARRYGDEPMGGRIGEHVFTTTRASTGTDAPDLIAAAPGTFNLTDSGNAEYFAARYGHDVRYDHRRGRWLLWRRHRWQPDADAEISRLAKTAMRQRFKDAATLDDPDARSRAAKWAIASESRARLDALLSLAQAEAVIADAGDGWDRDLMLLGVPNGVIDLRTGALRPGRREDRITMGGNVPYDPAATCPRWERFHAEVFVDPAVVGFVHRAIGYSLTGETGEQCLFLCYGTGANGKGTFTNTVGAVLGDYAYTMPFSTVELHQRSSIPNDVAALVARRLVVASETTDGARLNEPRLKALTGCDPITARFLHSEFFTFVPVAKFWLSVNHKPTVRDDSHGFWRRMRLIPFTQTFPVNQTLADELRAELPGILAWAVRGCLAWQRDGLSTPAVVADATREYERDSDPLTAFLDEACDLGADADVGASVLFEHYRRWSERAGLSDRERLTATKFGGKVSERFQHVHTRAGRVYQGLARRDM